MGGRRPTFEAVSAFLVFFYSNLPFPEKRVFFSFQLDTGKVGIEVQDIFLKTVLLRYCIALLARTLISWSGIRAGCWCM